MISTIEAGDILDTYFYIGNKLFGYLIVNPAIPVPDLKGSYRTAGHDCPLCEGENTLVIWQYCSHHQMNCRCSYCPDCWIAWEVIWIGDKL